MAEDRSKNEKFVDFPGYSKQILLDWKDFITYIEDELSKSKYIYRGQANAIWPLRSRLDRLLRNFPVNERAKKQKEHLQNFQYAVRGRRGPNPPILNSENDWWALGQHHGLATPLLDWTESPYVALYFSFAENLEDENKYRTVFALDEEVIKREQAFQVLDNVLHPEPESPPNIDSVESLFQNLDDKTEKIVVADVFRPMSDENQRLISQRSLFVRWESGKVLEDIIEKLSKERTYPLKDALIKIKIPNKDQHECLKYLNRYNINQISLFPDILGACQHCNNQMIISDYN